MEKSNKSALVIIPPESLWTQIQSIRSKHDKAYQRWMPHINLLYPFIEDNGSDFNRAAQQICWHISTRLKPFRVAFRKESFGYFTFGKSSTLWMKPLYVNEPSSRANNALQSNALQNNSPHNSALPRDAKTSKVMKHIQNESPIPTIPDAPRYRRTRPVKLVEPSIVNPYSQTGPPTVQPSLDGLRHNGWSTDIRPDEQFYNSNNSSDQPGLEGLQHAFWPPINSKPAGKINHTHKNKQGNATNENTKVTSNVGNDITNNQMLESENSEDEWSDEADEWTCSNDKTRSDSDEVKDDKEDITEDMIHPAVMKLQACLEAQFQLCDDLSNKSLNGFAPHLTLGQFKNQIVAKRLDDFCREWKDIEFEVNEIYMISRKDFNDPFHIRERIPLGSLESELACQ
ncbi:unnamed protein product [Owenia fusiformis]|uniref:Uncharacterized protein n=1 Tax=Owenia fusiformis TaxID=6347 RepID=A0A8J1TYW0_OWEFU|nr:unnamed protein product [Owenia fusiformis]